MPDEQAPSDITVKLPGPESNGADSWTVPHSSTRDEERLAAAKKRQQWRESPEYRRWTRTLIATVIGTLLLIAVVWYLSVYLGHRVNEEIAWGVFGPLSVLLLYLAAAG